MLQENKPSLEETVQQLAVSTQSFMTSTDTNLKNQAMTIHNLEVQARQMASLLYKGMQGSLPSNTKKNLKEQVHAITLKSGRVLEQNRDVRVEEEDQKDTVNQK